jgi:hypothetical protein
MRGHYGDHRHQPCERPAYYTRAGTHYHLTLRCCTFQHGREETLLNGYRLGRVFEDSEIKIAKFRPICKNCRKNARYGTLPADG